MATERPIDLDAVGSIPTDDGLFGPDSVTWRVMGSSATSVGAGAAVLMQMLHPKVMRIIDQASNVKDNPEERARLTSDYAISTTYGDTEVAERAGEVLRRIHSRRKATDPITGETYTADEPELLLWVHCTLTWSLLRAYDRWGPKLTQAERDQFVDEQRIAARLVGIEDGVAPANVADLEGYIEKMRPQLAYIVEAKYIRELIVPPRPPFSVTGFFQRALSRASVDILPDYMQELYGFDGQKTNRLLINTGMGLFKGLALAKVPAEKIVPSMREYAATHQFGGRVKRRKAAEAKATTPTT